MWSIEFQQNGGLPSPEHGRSVLWFSNAAPREQNANMKQGLAFYSEKHWYRTLAF